MNGFEQATVQEMMNRQEENFRDREARKRDDANVDAVTNTTTMPDVRERRKAE